MTTEKKIVPSVSVSYTRNGSSTKANSLGMRPMQERAYERRGEQYLLIKSPPASGKSRALMFIALDKLTNQGLKQAIIVVPEKSIGSSFADEELTRFGFWADWTVKPQWNLCNVAGIENTSVAKSKVKAVGQFLESDDRVLVCTHATFRFAVEELGVDRPRRGALAHLGRDADGHRTRGDVLDHDGVGADLCVVTDADRTEDLRPRADHDAAAERRVPLAVTHRAPAQGRAVEEHDVVADLGGLADDDPHAVVDEQAVAELGGGVDLDARGGPRRLREQASGQPQAGLVPHLVCEPVGPHRVHARVRDGDLEARARGGVFTERDLEVVPQDGPERTKRHGVGAPVSRAGRRRGSSRGTARRSWRR